MIEKTLENKIAEKIGLDIEVDKLWHRALEASKLKNLSALADKLGITQQAVSATIKRNSIKLELVMSIAELTGRKIDWLLYGDDEQASIRTWPKSNDQNDYICIDRIGGGQVKILKELIEGLKDSKNYLALVKKKELSIIDIDDTILGDGLFYLGKKENIIKIIIRKCRALADGSIEIEGEAPKSPKELDKVAVLGRVVWQGSAV